MGLILSIETATTVCSVALHKDGSLLGVQELHLQKSHSEFLAVLIKELVRYTGYELNDLDYIAVSKGPGSYTGLRIGTATAKGLCFALEKPLVSINTLQAMAFGMSKYFQEEGVLLCPMIDARRMEVYCLLADTNLNIVEDTAAVIIDENSFKERLDVKRMVFFGDGASKCRPLLSSNSNAKFIENVKPTAQNVGEAVFEMLKNNLLEPEDLAYFEPYYLKDFQAKKAKSAF